MKLKQLARSIHERSWITAHGFSPWSLPYERKLRRCEICGHVEVPWQPSLITIYEPKSTGTPLKEICQYHRGRYGDSIMNCLTGESVTLKPERAAVRKFILRSYIQLRILLRYLRHYMACATRVIMQPELRKFL